MRTWRSGLGLLVAPLLALGCARGPDVASEGFALRRVIIYRNGVGYFERAGVVEQSEITFRVRKERVGDFLATLAVIEAGGSSVRSASFPVEVVSDDDEGDEGESDPRYEVLLKPPPPKAKKKKDALETVKLTLDGERHDLIIGYVAETPVWRPSYRLVIGKKSGEAAGSADLQAWGIVQNLSGEDWKGVKLSLVAGAPLAFQATLEKAVIPARPIVTDEGEVIASVPTSETSLRDQSQPEAPPPPPPPPGQAPSGGYSYGFSDDGDLAGEGESDASKGDKSRARPAKDDARKKMKREISAETRSRVGTKSAPKVPQSGYFQPEAPEPDVHEGPSRPRNVSALAAVAMEAGTTRYDLPFPVDIPDKSATMVLLLARKVPGETIFLFAPDPGVPDSRSHPFRVARFTNNGKGLLERGPIAVFESGAFLGQGMVEPLPPGATTTVPFALERSLAVDQTRTETQQGARVAKIEAGELEIERDWVTHTKYAVKNGAEDPAKTLVKHPRMQGTRLHDPPKGTEDNLGTGSALVPVDVPKHGTAVLDVDERRIFTVRVDWLAQLADDAVKAYLADARADPAVVAPLRAAWEVRAKLRALTDERDKLLTEQSKLATSSDELRRNLRAIEKNKAADALRKDLTDRLAKASARLDEITKRSIELEMQLNEQWIRFRDLIAPIKMLKPLSPVKS